MLKKLNLLFVTFFAAFYISCGSSDNNTTETKDKKDDTKIENTENDVEIDYAITNKSDFLSELTYNFSGFTGDS